MNALPEHGRPRAEVLEALRAHAADDPDYKGGRLWSLVYWLDEEHEAFMGRAYQSFSSANGPIIDTDASLIPPNLFNMDPPRHDELRSVLSRALTPRHINSLEPHVEALLGNLPAAALLLERGCGVGRGWIAELESLAVRHHD